MTQPLYQQWSSTSRWTTVVLFILYYSAVLCKHHIDKREKGYSSRLCSLRWNPNNVPTTCKPTTWGLASRYMYDMYVHWSCVKETRINGFEKKTKKGNWRWHSFSIILIFWLFTRLLILCGSSDIVIGLHFLWNNFLCRVWNMEYLYTVKATKEFSCGELFVANVRRVTL